MSCLTLALSSAGSLCVAQADLELSSLSGAGIVGLSHHIQSKASSLTISHISIKGRARFSDSLAVPHNILKLVALSNVYYHVTILKSGIWVWFSWIFGSGSLRRPQSKCLPGTWSSQVPTGSRIHFQVHSRGHWQDSLTSEAGRQL